MEILLERSLSYFLVAIRNLAPSKYCVIPPVYSCRDLMQRFQVDVKLAKPRSPWTGGRFERLIQSLKRMLVAKLHEFPAYSVELALKVCLFDYNT